MYTTHIISATLALLGAVTAAPAPTAVMEARACKTAYPSLSVLVVSSEPNSIYGPTGSVQLLSAPSVPNTVDTIVSFSGIQSGSYGCQVALQFPDPRRVSTSGASRLDVYSVDRNVTVSDTWNNSPQKVALFGSVDLATNIQPLIYLNSQACTETMTFRFELSDLTKDGEVGFPLNQETGLEVLYDC